MAGSACHTLFYRDSLHAASALSVDTTHPKGSWKGKHPIILPNRHLSLEYFISLFWNWSSITIRRADVRRSLAPGSDVTVAENGLTAQPLRRGYGPHGIYQSFLSCLLNSSAICILSHLFLCLKLHLYLATVLLLKSIPWLLSQAFSPPVISFSVGRYTAEVLKRVVGLYDLLLDSWRKDWTRMKEHRIGTFNS